MQIELTGTNSRNEIFDKSGGIGTPKSRSIKFSAKTIKKGHKNKTVEKQTK